MTFKFITLGCKVNFYESNALREELLSLGYVESNKPDIVIINTCSVTQVADQKSRQHIRKYSRNFPNSVIAVMGCYSQKNANFILNECGAHIVVGTSNRDKIPVLIEEYLKTKNKCMRIDNDTRNLQYENFNFFAIPKSTRAYVKIQDGCNNFCSYCTIPYTRGNSRSRDFDSIIKEISTLVKKGFKEIVLTGIHTAHYGIDLKSCGFGDLLESITNINGLYRVRISSIEESEISDKVIEILKSKSNIANHLHIPLQSGSSSVLRRMNRKYNVEDFKKKVDQIRSFRPDIAITTDVIVGFPGETDKEFEETYNFINEIGFAELHVFPFSAREGTKAFSMENQVPSEIKNKRVSKLLELSNDLRKRYISKFYNQNLEVLFEERDKNTNLLKGHTSNYLLVSAALPETYIGKIINIKADIIE